MVRNGLHINILGTRLWYNNNHYNRLNGPSIEWLSGDKDYYQNGLLHRLDGPASICDAIIYWYYQGKRVRCNTQEEFERLIKLRLLW